MAIGPYVFIVGLLVLISIGMECAVRALAGYLSGYPLTPTANGMAAASSILLGSIAVIGAIAWIRFDLNEFSMNHFYKNRLIRCFMGAGNSNGEANHFTGLNFNDDYRLPELLEDAGPVWRWKNSYAGPFPIVNTALNTAQGGDLDMQDRKAESFVFTPAYSGEAGSRLAARPGERRERLGVYRPSNQYIEPGGIHYGTTVAISGAAASPNMGYHTSPGIAFLLTMFNVRLGWWVPNPREECWRIASPTSHLFYLMCELFGSAKRDDRYVYLSDGGHFENLGIYELVRRKCGIIIACDGEQDGNYTFESLAGVIRKCFIDFNIEIQLDTSAIGKRDEQGWNGAHYAIGKIKYGDRPDGALVYLKSSMTGNEPVDLMQYKAGHPDFPHESTADQFFTEDQFESYRHLGELVSKAAFENAWTRCGKNWSLLPKFMARAAATRTDATSAFTRHATTLSGIWRCLAADPELEFLDKELFPDWSPIIQHVKSLPAGSERRTAPPSPRKAFYLSQEMIQLMEDVYTDLSLEETYEHPDNKGWVSLFRYWSKSPTFHACWEQSCQTYGERFQDFCWQRLGLPRCPDAPPERP